MIQWVEPAALGWLWTVLPALALGAWAVTRRRAMLRRFAGPVLSPRLVPGGGVGIARVCIKWVLLVAASASVIVALARPCFALSVDDTAKPPVRKSGRDVCFIVDVSRSMLAEDVKPTRLDRAKLWLKDVIESVRGDRVSVVAFAGLPVVKCPLTHDYAFARMAIDELSPTSVARGGTNIGDAVRLALTEVFGIRQGQPVEATNRDIFLITDGEDHDSAPIEAAQAAGAASIRLIAVGLGDDRDGARIPVAGEHGRRAFLTYQGREVFSKLDSTTLQSMALATPGGAYFNVGTGTIELDKVYKSLSDTALKGDLGDSDARPTLPERFQWPVGAALAILLLEMFIGERRRGARV